MNETLIIAAFIFVGVYLLAFFIYIGFRENLKFKQRQHELEVKVRMDDFRSHLERGVTDLNKEFSRNPDRFKELNHMPLSGQAELSVLNRSKTVESAFLRAHGIEIEDMPVRPRSIFVLTPFHKDFDSFFETLTEVGQDINYRISRGDERVSKSDIFNQILHGIVTSRFIIANITGRNANVFYELGVAHALDKEVILIAESDAEVPFDLQSKRIIFYDNQEELRIKLTAAIARMSETY